jgi:hypothetical protein
MHKQLSLLESARVRQPELSDARHIEEIAARILADLDEKPPVDLDVVASYLGIGEIRRVPLPMSGCLAPNDDRLVMLLNQADSPRRQRFTGFHEVGHAFQPGYWLKNNYRCAPMPTPVRPRVLDTEALSDIAATALLFPETHFSADVEASSFSLGSITELADGYDASVQATTYNFQRHWPEPTLTVILEPRLKKAEVGDPSAEPRLRVVSVHPNGAGWPYVPPNKSASDAGLLVRALNGEIIDARSSLGELDIHFDGNLDVTARAFRYRAGGEIRDRVIAIYRQTPTKRRRQESRVAKFV